MVDFIVFAIVLFIGLSAGLRTFTAPAVVALGAWLGFIDLSTTTFSFVSTTAAAMVLSFMAIGEYVYDLIPNVPSRTAIPGLIGRIATGIFSSVCLLAATGRPVIWCLLGGAAAVGAAFAGMHLRRWLGDRLDVKDAYIAIPEDLVSIGLAVVACILAAGV